MHILTINCGSSSLKFKLLRLDGDVFIPETSGEISGIGTRPRLTLDEEAIDKPPPIQTHADAIQAAIALLAGKPRIDAVAYRIVHGGPALREPLLLDDASIHQIEAVSELAPLHNRPAVEAIYGAKQALGDLPMVAVFDTAFHADMPKKASRYAIGWDLAERHAIRRFGFHGLAHQFMAESYADLTGRPLGDLKLITLQLGSGCSAAAILGGRSIDTSMGLTPLEGLIMETRSGDVDPSIMNYLAEREGLSTRAVESLLNEQSGLKGLAGVRDMREVLAAETQGNERAALAVEMFVYRIQKYIGAYLVALGGGDAITFGGGIGENATRVRSRIIAGLAWLGVGLDEKANAAATGIDARISNGVSSIDVWTIAVDESLILAREAARFLGQSKL